MTNRNNQFVVSAEEAVFWMDAHGRWCNAHGRIGHKRTVDYLNRCIGHDAGGWFVRQRRGHLHEKVYFRCPHTALFAIDLEVGDRIVLVLNTRRRIALKPRCLEITEDSLFQREGPVRIKFTARAAAKLMPLIEESRNQWLIRVGGRRYRIAQTDTAGARQDRKTRPDIPEETTGQ